MHKKKKKREREREKGEGWGGRKMKEKKMKTKNYNNDEGRQKGLFQPKIRVCEAGKKKGAEEAKLKENIKRREIKELYGTNIKVSIVMSHLFAINKNIIVISFLLETVALLSLPIDCFVFQIDKSIGELTNS